MVSKSVARTESSRSTPRKDSLEPAEAGPSARRRIGADTTEEWLRRFRMTGWHARFARVVERHRSTVEAMASSLATRLPPSVDARDLVHAGLWGLMQAIHSYEPARCDQFSAFMRIRVRGAMLDELRHLDFLPRLSRRRVRERDQVRARLRMELAAALGITEAALLRRCEPALLRPVRTADEGGEDHVDQLADDGIEPPIEAITRQEQIDLIRSSLDPVEWQVLELHYLEGLTG